MATTTNLDQTIGGDLLTLVTAPVFGVGSFLRRRRIVHPVGTGMEVRMEISDTNALLAGSLLGRPGVTTGVLRLSRGLGRGPDNPDYRGFALKTAQGTNHEQDILLVSAVRSGRRDVLAESASYTCRYCSLLPFDAGNGPIVLHALPRSPMPRDGAVDAGRVRGIEFDLGVGRPGRPWLPFATVVIGAALAPDATEHLRFDPFHDGGGLRPLGSLNVARQMTYRASQLGRAAWWRPPSR